MISFFLKYEELLVQLPVNPESITIVGGANNSTSEVVNIGEVTNIGFTKLKEIKIDCFFPKYVAGYVQTAGQFEGPSYYIDFLERIQKDRQPLRLIVTDTNINMMMSIQDFEWGIQHGTEDVNYSLSLKEYRTHNVRILKPSTIATAVTTTTTSTATVSPTTTNSKRPVEKAKVTTYKIKKGDTLWLIAQRLLGRGNRWKEIYNYSNNKKIIGGNPNKLKVGKTISIPKR